MKKCSLVSASIGNDQTDLFDFFFFVVVRNIPNGIFINKKNKSSYMEIEKFGKN